MAPHSNRNPFLIAAILCAVSAPVNAAAPPAAQPSTSSGLGDSARGAAAIVDGYVIPMCDIELSCLRTQREYVVGQMIQNYVIERECKKRGLAPSEAEIDRSVADLRKQYTPVSLEDTIAAHGWTMLDLRDQFCAKLGRQRLVAAGVKPVKITHCREILVKYGHGDERGRAGRTEAEALAIVKSIQEQLRLGKDFGDLASQYSEAETRSANGDIGALYSNMLGNVEECVLTEALALNSGEVSKAPVKTADGYCLIQVVSTSDAHSAAEEDTYRKADAEARRVQVMFHEPKVVGDLIRQSQITSASDAELVPGKPLPRAAAVIDGHSFLMKTVLAKCVANGGRAAVDVLVQNYVVDRECKRRGIVVSDAEIDQAVADFRRRIAPHTIEEGLPAHHTTMAGLRSDFHQQIERTKLVMDQVKPAKMVHCRVISLRDNLVSETSPAVSETRPVSMMDASAYAEHLAGQVPAALGAVQAKLRSGQDFRDLARQYSDSPLKESGGDAGILYPGVLGADTAFLNAALTMKKGQITPEPVKTYDGYVLIQAVSTGDDHPAAEDPSYAAALAAYKEQQAQPLIPDAVRDLVQKSKVTYYLKF